MAKKGVREKGAKCSSLRRGSRRPLKQKISTARDGVEDEKKKKEK